MDEDNLLRSATQFAEQANDGLRVLSVQEDVDLYQILAQQTIISQALPSPLSFKPAFSVDDLLRDDAAVEIGKRLFRRWSIALHQFACVPDQEDQDIRARLLAALTGKEGGAAVVAGILVATFGLSPAVAAIVATLLLRIIISPTVEEVCEVWGRKLDTAGTSGSKAS